MDASLAQPQCDTHQSPRSGVDVAVSYMTQRSSKGASGSAWVMPARCHVPSSAVRKNVWSLMYQGSDSPADGSYTSWSSPAATDLTR